MREIEQDVKRFLKILYSQCPEIKGRVKYDLTFSHSYKCFVYDLGITFPSNFCNEVYNISKFCGLTFIHRYDSCTEGTTRFESGAQFF